MSTQVVEVAVLRELRTFRSAAKQLLVSTVKLSGYLLTYGANSLAHPKLSHASGKEVELPSQRPQWVYGHVPRGLHHER